MNTESLTQTQISIVGAGLVGMAAAVALNQAGLEVLLIDAKNPIEHFGKNQDDNWDQKVYAISPKNVQWLKTIGVWRHIDISRVCRVGAMQIWGDASSTPLNLVAEEVNKDNMAYVLENKSLMHAFAQELQLRNIQTKFGHAAQGLNVFPNKAILEFHDGNIESELLLAADGNNSWVRNQLNIAVTQKDYDQVAIVANFDIEKPHDHIARQWFAHDENGQNSILAFLPLPGNKVSIVWSLAKQYGQELMALNEDAFTQKVISAGKEISGNMKMITPAASFPLALQTGNAITQEPVVLIGDAAHQIHPLAGQGMNLGFRDVIDLIAILQSRNAYQALGDPRLLKQYSRVRKEDAFDMRLLTDGLYRLFAHQQTGFKKIRNWGLSLANNSSAIKKLLVEKAIAL